MATSIAANARQVKPLQVQDEITASVINQIQDQQKQMAENLIKMMDQSTIDVYA